MAQHRHSQSSLRFLTKKFDLYDLRGLCVIESLMPAASLLNTCRCLLRRFQLDRLVFLRENLAGQAPVISLELTIKIG
jgi:hypothetical protein